MKTVKEWLMELPDGYRERALAQCTNPDREADTLDDAIGCMGNWDSTVEGLGFWADVHWHFHSGTNLPKLPNSLSVYELLAENAQLKDRLQCLEDMVLNALEALQEKP